MAALIPRLFLPLAYLMNAVIPIFRFFDYRKAVEFYVDWLGFTIAWEHQFEPETPVYMEVHREGIRLHLSEHHGDATPGSKALVEWSDVRAYCAWLSAKQYKYYRPGAEETFWNALAMDVTDPFGNHLTFYEELVKSE